MGNLEYLVGGPHLEVQDEDVDQMFRLLVEGCKKDGQDPMVEQIRDEMREGIRTPGYIVVMDDKKMVGVGSFKVVNKTEDGRPIVELRRSAINPNYQSQYVGHHLYMVAIKIVETLYPNAVIVAATRSRYLKKSSPKRGYRIVSVPEFAELANLGDETDLNSMEERGFFGTVFDQAKLSPIEKVQAKAQRFTDSLILLPGGDKIFSVLSKLKSLGR